MKMKLSELEANGYTLVDTLGHMDIVPFVQTYMKKRTLFSMLYITFNVLAVAMVGWLFGLHVAMGDISFSNGFGNFSYGVLIAFLLIPIHEFIHVLAYRSQGAEKTSYDVNLKKFYFMAVADQFVASRREFQMVALAPFVVISTVLVILFFVANPLWQFTIIGIFFTHTACCGGDFGLLSYFSFRKNEEVVTCDDAANKRTYFFVKNGGQAKSSPSTI